MVIRRAAATAMLASLSACGQTPGGGDVYDAVLAQQDGAAFIGAGTNGAVRAALQCDGAERLNNSDWPALAVWLQLPELGNEFEAAGKGFAKVDGRKVKVALSLAIDGRDIPLTAKQVRRDDQIERALLIASIDASETFFDALANAETIAFSGDGGALRIDLSQSAEDRAEIAEICREVAAAAGL